MSDDSGGEVQPEAGAIPPPISKPDNLGSPPLTPADPQPAITDEDRHAYGRLLDSAMERGFLDVAEYGMRLHDLAMAISLDEMKEIVTELPIFSGVSLTGPL